MESVSGVWWQALVAGPVVRSACVMQCAPLCEVFLLHHKTLSVPVHEACYRTTQTHVHPLVKVLYCSTQIYKS